MTHNEFLSTIKIYSHQSYKELYPKKKVHKNAIWVATYDEGLRLQFIKGIGYLAEKEDANESDEVNTTYQTDRLENAEVWLWQQCA